jgi:hypothetical protein
MRNLAKVLMMAMVVLAGASTASAKTLTLDEAAQKLYNAEQKAGETKKDVTVTVKVVGTKKNKSNKVINIDKKFSAKFLEGVTNEKFIKNYSSLIGIEGNEMTTQKGDAKSSFSDGVVKIKVTFNGKLCRSTNDSIKFAKMNLAEFEERIQAEQPQTQREIAWFCAKFVSEHAKMNFANRKTNTEKGFYQKKSGGDCSDCALWIATYMKYAGVKHYGTVSSKKADHEWNYVIEDGVKYYFEASDSEDVLRYGADDNYVSLANMTLEEFTSDLFYNGDNSDWEEAQNAGSEANYYVMSKERWAKRVCQVKCVN